MKKHNIGDKVFHIPTKSEVRIHTVSTLESMDYNKKIEYKYTYSAFTTCKEKSCMIDVSMMELSLEHPDKDLLDEIKELKAKVKNLSRKTKVIAKKVNLDKTFKLNEKAIFRGNSIERKCIVKAVFERNGRTVAYVVFQDNSSLVPEAEVGIEKIFKL